MYFFLLFILWFFPSRSQYFCSNDVTRINHVFSMLVAYDYVKVESWIQLSTIQACRWWGKSEAKIWYTRDSMRVRLYYKEGGDTVDVLINIRISWWSRQIEWQGVGILRLNWIDLCSNYSCEHKHSATYSENGAVVTNIE